VSSDIEINERIAVTLRARSVTLSVADDANKCGRCDAYQPIDPEAPLKSRAEIDKLISALTHARDTLFPAEPVSVADDCDGCDGWSNEIIFDVLNVLEAHRDHELQYVEAEHLESAQKLGLMVEDRITEKGKLFLLGYLAAKQVAEVEKGLLFAEIDKLKET